MIPLATLVAPDEKGVWKVGYCIDQLPRRTEEKDTATTIPWPLNPSRVTQHQEFEKNIAFLVTRVETVLALFPPLSIEGIKIGKTSVSGHKQRTFSASNFHTWRYGSTSPTSPGARWRGYKAKGFHGFLVLACFDRHDISPVFEANELTQQHVALAYEGGLTNKLMVNTFLKEKEIQVIDGDPGGGGRAAVKAYAGGIVYMAIKLKSPKKEDTT